MQVSVSGRHMAVSDSLKEAASEKIGRLEKFLPGLDHAEVHFFEEKNPRIREKDICEVTLQGHGHHVRCKVAAPDGMQAVDLAYDKLEKQLSKLKTKLKRYDKHAKTGHAQGLVPQPEPDPQLEPDVVMDDLGYRIVKTKAFELERMTPFEAALQTDLVDHDFYLFHNASSGEAGVVYRRDDGDVGLIDAALPG